MSRSLRLTFVCPRFEPVTAVGVEVQVRLLADLLVRRGHRVEVATTCVRDPMTWKNHYAPGLSAEGGITVRRFPADPRRLSRRRLEIDRRIAGGGMVGRADAEEWLAGLGFSSGLRDYVARSSRSRDAFLFAPALTGTTWGSLAAASGKAVVLAALPDGPAARLEAVRELLRRSPLILAGSETESRLIAELAGVQPERILQAGVAAAPAPEYDAGRFRRRHGLEVPFLMYAGRRTADKEVQRLLAYVGTLARSGGVDLRLVLCGEGHLELPDSLRDTVLDLHFIDEQDKADGLAAALAYCQPSSCERLGMAAMESWLAGRPVLAEAGGSVTRERCRSSGGGLWHGSYFEFEECVRLLRDDTAAAAAMGASGRAYVRRTCSPERIVGQIEAAFSAVAGGSA